MAAGPAIEDASHAQITNPILLVNQDQGGRVEKDLSYYFLICYYFSYPLYMLNNQQKYYDIIIR